MRLPTDQEARVLCALADGMASVARTVLYIVAAAAVKVLLL